MFGKLRVFVVCTSLLSVAGNAGAQGLAPLQAKLTQVYGTMLGSALPDIAKGEATILEASGRKDDAAKLRTAADKMIAASLKPDNDAYAAGMTSISDGTKQLSDAQMTNAGKLDSTAQKQFIGGLTQYVTGTVKLNNLKSDATQLAGMIGSATQGLSMMDAMRAKSTVNLAKAVSTGVPDVAAKSVGGLQAIKAFAASRNIPIPPNLLQGM
jgi:hypothetical protein